VKSSTVTIEVSAPARYTYLDLTEELERAIKDSGVTDGAAIAFCPHTTCALLINDIPLSRTLAYCGKLRRLIRELRLEALVDVVVESEHVSTSDFDRAKAQAVADAHPVELTPRHGLGGGASTIARSPLARVPSPCS